MFLIDTHTVQSFSWIWFIFLSDHDESRRRVEEDEKD
jgi:hypothetical protein